MAVFNGLKLIYNIVPVWGSNSHPPALHRVNMALNHLNYTSYLMGLFQGSALQPRAAAAISQGTRRRCRHSNRQQPDPNPRVNADLL